MAIKSRSSNEKDVQKNIHEGHRERLRQRFLKEGLQNFQPHNVLELLLFFSIPLKDTNEEAHALINTFGSLSGVFDASFEIRLNHLVSEGFCCYNFNSLFCGFNIRHNVLLAKLSYYFYFLNAWFILT